jgi:branched-chain amino acid transport system ATP-binding protein
LLAFPLLYVAFSVGNTAVMLVVFTFGSGMIIAAIPPLNAVRLDVLHPRLRGRGTALDSVLQSLCAAASPLIFGILSDWLGLRAAFLILIPLLAVAGAILLLFAVRTYGPDEARVLAAVAAESGPAIDESLHVPIVVEGPISEDALIDDDAADLPPAEQHGDILVAKDICFSYGSIQVLFNTELRVQRGGCHALIGRNGVGKSTLLNVLAGLLEPQEGQIWLNGRAITGVPPEQRARLGLTLMGGGRATFPSLSLRENLWLGSYPFSTHKDLVEERMAAVLDVFPALRSHLTQPAGTLSGGEQQMMSLGRALMAGPEILLVDELSMGLAPVVTEELLRVVRRIVDLGTTVLMVEQSVAIALRVADDVLFMDKQGIRDLGPPADLADGETLARLMLLGTDRGGP